MLRQEDEDGLKRMKNEGKTLIQIDSKHDTNEKKLPATHLNTVSESGRSLPGVSMISPAENQKFTAVLLQTVRDNIPCDREDCQHSYQYRDIPGGFERVRMCDMNEEAWCSTANSQLGPSRQRIDCCTLRYIATYWGPSAAPTGSQK